MQEKKEFNQNEYIKNYNKKHYIQRKIYFKPEEIDLIDIYLKENNITLKDLILNTVRNKK